MLRGLLDRLSGKKPGLEVHPRLSPAVVAGILQSVGNRSIPPLLGAAQRAFQLATDPNAEARDFIDVIESDEGLSARVLKISNSVFFDRGKKSRTIEEAVLVIGINELRCLLNATTLCDIFPSKHPLRAQFWANDIATALISRRLAQRVIPPKAEVAFLAGLMHDVGKLLLLQRNAESYIAVLKEVESRGEPYYAVEQEVFGFDHTQVGQLVGERWHFSDELLEAISNHHRPLPKQPPADFDLSLVVQAADIVAHSLALGDSPKLGALRARMSAQLPLVWQIFRIPEGEQHTLLDSWQLAFDAEKELYSGNN